MDILVCFSTCPDASTAERIARTLVESRLAACVNLLPGVRSIYRWEGAIASEAEVLMMIKTTTAQLPALREHLVALHPYDVPELIALPVADGLPAYLQWIADGVAPVGTP
ncbi:divalent-cation tolerance protein CutA [Luteimonas terrae]|uniref:Periplasmic divalent cation tolerance protein n=1 Tax=Luteimonas terrae TaxID=1530191 RepID=A0ABU1XU98_9GAMM|nr:divalent-cation tolerance protein CutA [Luteimonas terrae]MDR7192344.1 periplasmic divalent cation tolerance protein [Luteimonas terrae]